MKVCLAAAAAGGRKRTSRGFGPRQCQQHQCLQTAGLREERSHSPGVRRFLQRVPAVSGSRPRHRCDDMVPVITVIILLAVQCSGQQLTGLPPLAPHSTLPRLQQIVNQQPDTNSGVCTRPQTQHSEKSLHISRQ